jgi:hypothetical protein
MVARNPSVVAAKRPHAIVFVSSFASVTLTLKLASLSHLSAIRAIKLCCEAIKAPDATPDLVGPLFKMSSQLC